MAATSSFTITCDWRLLLGFARAKGTKTAACSDSPKTVLGTKSQPNGPVFFLKISFKSTHFKEDSDKYTWKVLFVHYYIPESKRTSMQWKYQFFIFNQEMKCFIIHKKRICLHSQAYIQSNIFMPISEIKLKM